MIKHKPTTRSKRKRSSRPLDRRTRAATIRSAVIPTVQSEAEFQRIVHELQVHQEELEAQNEELRETQQLLETSRDRYADLYDFAPIGYTTIDEKGHVREINLTGATILGRERSRLLGTLFSVAVARDDLHVFRDHLRQCQQTSGPVTTELTLAVRGRDPVPVQLYSVPIPDLVSRTTTYRTAITDITVRKQAETILRLARDQLEDRVRERTKELAGAVTNLRKEVSERERAEKSLRRSEESLKLFRTLVDHSNDSLEVIDPATTQFLDVSLRGCQDLGYSREELLSMSILDISPEIDVSLWQARMDTLRRDKSLTVFGYHQRKDGTRFPVEVNVSFVQLDRDYLVAVVRDITERKQTEEALRRLSVSLLQTQDEERRRIARELHDSTGQKLAALAMNLSLIGKSAGSLDPPARKALADGVALLDQSSQEIRTLSYLLHPPLLDERGLGAAVRWFADGFSQRSGVQVTLEVPQDLQRLPEEIEMALFRIVQEGLTNTHRHSGSSTATIRLTVDENHVRLAVQDAGKGLPEPRMVDDDAALGVGITGMRERVKQLGGQMKMKSGPRGTTVSVTLPLARVAL
jgi:PAS domain S-box-containing protein